MNRIPPNLLYLTIYNPTLRPNGPIDGDDEDAEEQAHILFYTSKERAVSRDRMLRQIGLAKALINFAELFNTDDACDNVHSQAKRMVMVSPEPNFWIHAGVEVAKVPRKVDSKNKSKAKAKAPEKGTSNETPTLYDYDEGSVHDSALKAHILQAYDRFKLTHGSFTSILSTLGQQALELQLERFWTVWAWSWDLEEKIQFGEQFGALLHPLFTNLVPLVDGFSDNLSNGVAPVVLSRKFIIPSRRYTEGRYTSALATHLSSMIPIPIEPSKSSDTLNTLASSVDTIKGKHILESNPTISRNSNVNDGGTFLGIPAMNMNMDMKKWNWPGYLTFGKGSTPKPPLDKSTGPVTERGQDTSAADPAKDQESRVQVEVDASELQDAISSDSRSIASGIRNGLPHDGTHVAAAIARPSQSHEPHSEEENRASADNHSEKLSSLIPFDLPEDSPPPSPPPLPEFSLTRLNLAPFQDLTNTRKTTVHYLIVGRHVIVILTDSDWSMMQKGEFLLALVDAQRTANENPEAEVSDLQIAAEKVTKLFDDLESTIYDAGIKSSSESLPSATKILQSQDRYLMSTGIFTHGSPGFVSTSSHLFNAKDILDIDPEISEVFSRGQNPQHWHIAKRGFGNTQNTEVDKLGSEEAVFMEIFRKETSLTDVDNVLTGVVKKSGLVDGSVLVRM